MDHPLIYRKNKLFSINNDKLPVHLRKQDIINSLLIAIFKEFSGAIYNDKYRKMTYEDRMKEINIFAENWIKKI